MNGLLLIRIIINILQMFKIIKNYISLINDFNNTNKLLEIKELKNKINEYEVLDLWIKIDDISNLIDKQKLNFPIWIYIDYYNKKILKSENIFLSIVDLTDYIKKNLKTIVSKWWLNCFLVASNKKNIFFQLHYQNTIVKFHKKV